MNYTCFKFTYNPNIVKNRTKKVKGNWKVTYFFHHPVVNIAVFGSDKTSLN